MSDRVEIHTDPHGATLILFDGVIVAQMTPGNPPTFVDAFIEDITTSGITQEQLDEEVYQARLNREGEIIRKLREFIDDL